MKGKTLPHICTLACRVNSWLFITGLLFFCLCFVPAQDALAYPGPTPTPDEAPAETPEDDEPDEEPTPRQSLGYGQTCSGTGGSNAQKTHTCTNHKPGGKHCCEMMHLPPKSAAGKKLWKDIADDCEGCGDECDIVDSAGEPTGDSGTCQTDSGPGTKQKAVIPGKEDQCQLTHVCKVVCKEETSPTPMASMSASEGASPSPTATAGMGASAGPIS